jgi:hypothetical protein
MLKELHKPTPTAVFVIVVVVKVVLVLRQINGLRVKTIENLARVECMWSFYSDPICLFGQAKLQRGEDDG